MKKNLFVFFTFFLTLLQSCSFGVQEVSSSISSGGAIPSVHKKSRWTFMVYMAADNNLDSAALDDFREMECADCSDESVKTLVLFDRSQKKSNDKASWSGTRLYEITHDSAKTKSLQLSSNALGLNSLSSSELNMGDPETLIAFLDFSRKYYPAEHYALVIWGHGSGYRFAAGKKMRAVAIDDTSSSFMSTPDLRKAIKAGMGNDKVELLAFDTCFGSELEELYELKQEANWFAGFTGLQEASGWDYSLWMSRELESCSGGNEVAKIIERQYSANEENHFAIVKMDKIQDVFKSFNQFSKDASLLIKEQKTAQKIRDGIVSNPRAYAAAGSILNPVYVDISSMAKVLLNEFPQLEDSVSLLDASLRDATSEAYSSAQGIFAIGIYFCSLDEKKEISESFSPFYMQGSGAQGQCQFVQEAGDYVFSANQKGSLLDKLLGNYKFSL